jgi:type I restriction enzyme S subunit
MNGELPKGWARVLGSDLFRWSSGKFLPKRQQKPGTIPVYGGNGITATHDSALVAFPTLIIGRVGALCGNVYVSRGPAWITDNAIYASAVPAEIDLEYANLVFRQARLNEQSGGSGQPFVNQEVLNAVEIPLPPLAEQRRIVAALDTLVSKVEVSQKRLERIPTTLKRFRQSVLAAACSGRLTENWRQQNESDETGEELLRRVVRDRRRWWEDTQLTSFKRGKTRSKDDLWKARYVEPAPPDVDDLEPLPRGWTWGTWNQVANWVTYGFTRPMRHLATGVPIVTARHVVARKIELAETDKTPKAAFDELSAKDRPQVGDILITKDGSIGRAALVETDAPFCINQSVAVVWLRSLTLDRRFLLAAIEWPFTQHRIAEKARGAAIQHLSITDFARLPLPIPPLSEQQEIVFRLEALFKIADRIEARYQEVKSTVDHLTQSILTKAFRGELVPQDPA